MPKAKAMKWMALAGAAILVVLFFGWWANQRSIAYSNEAFSITKEGKLVPNQGFSSVTLDSGHTIVYNTSHWILTQDGGQTCFTGIDDINCEPACAEGELCINGVCMPVEPCGGACPEGQICAQGVCVPVGPCNPPCDPRTEVCVQGKCEPVGAEGETRCDPECGTDEMCVCMGNDCDCVPAPGPEEPGDVTVLL